MKKLLVVITSAFLTWGCAMPLGTISVHSVSNENELESPLIRSSEMQQNENTIYKSESDGSVDGDDVFAIYLTDTYLRFLQDFGGMNELLIVVTFNEVVTGSDVDTVTKILGPYKSIADATRAPLLNKLLYGPKKMESDILSMNLKVYEYDLEESEDNAAMLEFIAGSASALALADPITSGEIKIAKEIAQTLVRTNENDLVVDIDMDFVAGNAKYKPYTRSRVLPLRDSELVIVKQEACRVLTCYSYFGREGENPPGLITDTLLFIPTLLRKATTDVPDYDSLEEFEPELLEVSSSGLTVKRNGEKLEHGGEDFEDKTWLRLSIVKGGDPSLWEARKALYPQQQEIEKFLKNPNALSVANMQQFTARLIDIQKEILEGKAEVKLKSTSSQNGTHFISASATNTTSTLCLQHSDNVIIDSTNSKTINLAGVLAANTVAASKGKNVQCFDVTATFSAGKGSFNAVYTRNGKSYSSFFDVIVTPVLVAADLTATCTVNSDNKYKINFTGTKDKISMVTKITENGNNIGFTTNGTEVSITSTTLLSSATFSGILGGTANVAISGCPALSQ